MITLHAALTIVVSGFFSILFLQSGLDKVLDWKGNMEFHLSHFEKSPLKKVAPFMLIIVTVLEVVCGLMSAGGLLFIMMKDDSSLSFYACFLASLNFLALFFGQRISKDYKGAATLVPYFIVSLIGMYVTSM